MLPYLQHRQGQIGHTGETLVTLPAASPPHAALHTVHKHGQIRRPIFKRAFQAILLLCVLVPLWMLSKHVEIRVGGSRGSTASAGVGGRRMLGKVLPPAGGWACCLRRERLL